MKNKTMVKCYQCKICGFSYKTKEFADKCYNWCKTHKSCSMEITKHAIKNLYK